MQGSIIYLATTLSVVSIAMLFARPLWGVIGLFIARPLVDATWDQSLLLDFKLTEIVSAIVPVVIMCRIWIDSGNNIFRTMPLRWIWLCWSIDIVFFSSLIMFDQDPRSGVQVLMRHINGLAGFYMVQAYCRDEKDFLRFAWGLAIAGIFPMTTGLIEGFTGIHWRVTLGEGDIIRNVGLYHDAITIRYYALQTIMGLLVIYAIQKPSWIISLFCTTYAVAAAFVLKGAFSKSGILTLGSWILLWPLFRRSAKGLLGVLAASIVAVFYYSKQIMDSVGFVFVKEIAAVQGKGDAEQAFAGRVYLWEDLLKEFRSLDTFSQLFGAGHVASGAHNDYLQVMFHGGLVGVSIYIALLGSIGWAIFRSLLVRRDIWSIAPLFVFIMWMVDTIGLIPSAYSGYQWFAWGVIGACLRHRQNENHGSQDDRITTPVVPFPNLLDGGRYVHR